MIPETLREKVFRPAFIISILLFPLLLMSSSKSEQGNFAQSAQLPSPITSVEMQYYRIPRDKWDLLLSRMAQYNANTISTYVCWAWHEPEEGKFDFTGKTKPERDLVGFIELVKKHHLNLILKPGPFIDAELNAGGVPQWVFKKYPETIAISASGKPYIHGDSKMPRASYLHPKYLELTENYYSAFADAVRNYQFPEGPIIALQVDNETPGDGMSTTSQYLSWNFKADYSEFNQKTAWPAFLKKLYGAIDNLNLAYGSNFQGFSDVPMPQKWTDPKNQKEFQIYIDLSRFADFQPVESLRLMTAMLRKYGLYVPTYQDLLCMPWDMAGLHADIGGMAEAVGGWIGTNNYAEVYRFWTIFAGIPFQGLNWDEYIHMGPWRVKLTGSLSEPYPAFVPEITISGSKFYFQNPIAWGADAVNIYIGSQINPDNPEISPNKAWGMEACVSPDGDIRECFWTGKLTYLFMQYSGGFIPGAKKPDIAIGYSHIPENAWNWEYKWTWQKPHTKPKLKDIQPLVKGTNTGDRTQLIARDLVKQKIDFDVIHLEHLKPGQIEQYKLILIPATTYDPGPKEKLVRENGTWKLYLAPEDKDYKLDYFKSQGVILRQSWADDPQVDVNTRSYDNDSRIILAIINRAKKKSFTGPVHFRQGNDRVYASIGPASIGFVSIQGNGLKACLIDHPDGKGEYRLGDDFMRFSGTFAEIAITDQFAVISAKDSGLIGIKSSLLKKPEKLIRLFINGETSEADFIYQDGELKFRYDPGKQKNPTDLYLALPPGISTEQAIRDYLERIKF